LDISVPADVEKHMNGPLVKFGSDFGLEDFRLKIQVSEKV